jgi:histidinol-phosphate aminotransferase
MTDTPGVRKEVRQAKAYVAGLSMEEIARRHGLDRLVKMASNENPLGTSPLVARAVKQAADRSFRYPRHGYPELRAALAGHLGCPGDRLVCGNGSDEVIDLLVRAVCEPGQDNIVHFRPCFSMYTSQANLCGVETRAVDLADDFSLPLGAALEACDENTALVFATTPDNPSGVATPAGDLAALARSLPSRARLVVDEAYVHFCDDPVAATMLPWLKDLDNVVVLRTFSKAYGLAGLRLGFGVMAEDLAADLMRVQIPFSVSLLAEVAGMAALGDPWFLEKTVDTVRSGRDYLYRELSAMGCLVHPSQANFLMFAPPPGGPDARETFEALLARGVIIRPLASYGLADRLRVSVGNPDENRTFVRAAKEMFA